MKREQELLKRIEELERRIKELEARPPVQHHYYYTTPAYPQYHPILQPYIIPAPITWCNGNSLQGGMTTTVVSHDPSVPHTLTS